MTKKQTHNTLEILVKKLALYSLIVTLCNTRFNVLPAEYIYVFCMGLRKNNYYFRVQREEKRFFFGGGVHLELLVLKFSRTGPSCPSDKVRLEAR